MYGGAPASDKAIRQALNCCRESETPLASLAFFCDDLRHAGWNDTDVRAVETSVVRLLGGTSDLPREIPKCPRCDWPASVAVVAMMAATIYRCSDCRHQWREPK